MRTLSFLLLWPLCFSAVPAFAEEASVSVDSEAEVKLSLNRSCEDLHGLKRAFCVKRHNLGQTMKRECSQVPEADRPACMERVKSKHKGQFQQWKEETKAKLKEKCDAPDNSQEEKRECRMKFTRELGHRDTAKNERHRIGARLSAEGRSELILCKEKESREERKACVQAVRAKYSVKGEVQN